MRKLNELFDFMKKKFKRRKNGNSFDDMMDEEIDDSADEMDTRTPEGKKSMLSGDHGQIMGVDRRIVTGAAVFFVVIFCLAFIYASSSGSQKQTSQNVNRETQIAGDKALKDTENKKLSDDYGELERANQKKLGKNGNTIQAQQLQQRNNSNMDGQQPASNTVHANPVTAAVPAIPHANVAAAPASYGQSYSLPSQTAETSRQKSKEEQAEEEKQKSIAQRIKDTLSSAISFAASGREDAEAVKNAGNLPMADNAANVIQTGYNNGNNNPAYIAPTPNTLMAGTVIPAMLVTGINTDTPGQVLAQIQADVYDINGQNLLIPAGSRIVGTVQSSSNYESSRINVAFSQIVFPNGGAWNIGNSIVAIDGAGYSGIAGTLHHHTGSNFMKGIFNSAITALSTVAVDRVTLDASAFQSAVQKQKPTTTVDPGYSFNLYVTQNISF